MDSLYLGKTCRRHSEGADEDEKKGRRGTKRSYARKLDFRPESDEEPVRAAQLAEDESFRHSFELLQFEDKEEELPLADDNDDHEARQHDDAGDNATIGEEDDLEWNDVGVVESWIGKPTRTRYKVNIMIIKC